MADDDSPVHADHKIQQQFLQNVRFCALCGSEMRLRTDDPMMHIPLHPQGLTHVERRGFPAISS